MPDLSLMTANKEDICKILFRQLPLIFFFKVSRKDQMFLRYQMMISILKWLLLDKDCE